MTKESLSELGQLLRDMQERKAHTITGLTGYTETSIAISTDYVKPNVRMCKACTYNLVCLATHSIVEIYEREHNSIEVPLCCNCYDLRGYIAFTTADRCYLGCSLLENKVTDFNFSYAHNNNVHYNSSLVKKTLVALQENFPQLSLKNERIEEIVNIFKQHGDLRRQQYRNCIWVRLV